MDDAAKQKLANLVTGSTTAPIFVAICVFKV